MVAQLVIWVLRARKAEAELQIQDQAGPYRKISFNNFQR